MLEDIGTKKFLKGSFLLVTMTKNWGCGAFYWASSVFFGYLKIQLQIFF